MGVQTLLPARSNESGREYCWQKIFIDTTVEKSTGVIWKLASA
jgi:hypothetical protein